MTLLGKVRCLWACGVCGVCPQMPQTATENVGIADGANLFTHHFMRVMSS